MGRLSPGALAEAGMGPGLRRSSYWSKSANGLEHSAWCSWLKKSTTLLRTMRLSWSVIEAPTARFIPAWGETPRQGRSRDHFPQFNG